MHCSFNRSSRAEAMSLDFTPEEEKQLEYLLSKREKTKGPVPKAKVSRARGSAGGAKTDAAQRQRDEASEWSSSSSDGFVEIALPHVIESLGSGERWSSRWEPGKDRISLSPRL